MNLADTQLRLLALSMMMSTAMPEPGEEASVLSRIRELTSDELMQLAHSGVPRFNVQIDHAALDHGLRVINDRRERLRQLDYFINHGATTSLLRQLFRLPVVDIKARRRALLGAHRQRRPQLPAPHVREEIQKWWWVRRKDVLRTPPTIRDFIDLHQRFAQFSFATLHAVINEFE